MSNKLGKGLDALIISKDREKARQVKAGEVIDSLRTRIGEINKELESLRSRTEGMRKNLTMDIVLGNNPDISELRSLEDRITSLEAERKELIRTISETATQVAIVGNDEPAAREEARPEKMDHRIVERRSAEIDMDMIKVMIQEGKTPGETVGTGSVEEKSYAESIRSEIHPIVKLRRLKKEASSGKEPEHRTVPVQDDRPARQLKVVRKLVTPRPRTKDRDMEAKEALERSNDLIRTDDVDEAIILLESTIGSAGNMEELIYQLGNAYYIKGDMQKAEERFRSVIRTNPGSAKALNNLGVILRKQKRYEEAIRVINQSIEADQNYEKAWFNLGCIFMEIDPPLLKEASIFLKRALEIDPRHEHAKDQLRLCNEMMRSI